MEKETPRHARRRALPTIADVAARAGVSTATVDRVLNHRAKVRAATVRRVAAAAQDLGYVSDVAAFVAAQQRPMRILFLLPSGGNRYLALLGALITGSRAQLGAFNMRATLDHVDGFDPLHLAQRLRKAAREADGVVFMAIEHPAVREAVDALAAHGVPAITLISDLAGGARVAYVGLDNRAAGRTVGLLMGRFIGARAAKVAMIAGSLSYAAHGEREAGFLEIFRDRFPRIEIVGLREGRDEPEQNYRQTRALLTRHADLAGVYCIGGGPEGIARALKEARRDQDVVFIGHGLTPPVRALLSEGVMDGVITQNPQATLINCMSIFANVRTGRAPLDGVQPTRSEVIFAENLP